jgi:hypothetical protein
MLLRDPYFKDLIRIFYSRKKTLICFEQFFIWIDGLFYLEGSRFYVLIECGKKNFT